VVTNVVFDYLNIFKVADRLVALEVDGSGLDAGDNCIVRKDSRFRGAYVFPVCLQLKTFGDCRCLPVRDSNFRVNNNKSISVVSKASCFPAVW
jgi:hypothetical protein